MMVLFAAVALAGDPFGIDDETLVQWMDEGAKRVAAPSSSFDEAIIGRWHARRAIFRTFDSNGRSSVSDLAGLVGMGGYAFGGDGEYRAGALQLPGSYQLDGRHLLIVNPKQEREEFDIRVEGDRMEWYQSTPAGPGTARVDTYLLLRRDLPPDDCGEFGAGTERVAVLGGRYTVSLPLGAKGEQYGQLSRQLGTRLVVVDGESRLELGIREMALRFEPESVGFIESKLPAALPDGGDAVAAVHNSVRTWSVASQDPTSGSGRLLAGTIVHPDGYVQNLGIEVSSPQRGKGCASVARDVLASIRPGPRKNAVGPSVLRAGWRKLAVDIPTGWFSWTEPGDDAAQFWFVESVAYGSPEKRGQVKVRIPGDAWVAADGEERALLGEQTRWERSALDGITRLRACNESACIEASGVDPSRLEPMLAALEVATRP